MQEPFSYIEELFAPVGAEKLGRAKIAVFGLGSVGSYVAMALARSGVGSLTLVDHGKISENEFGNHPFACCSNIGKNKVQVLKERILDIDKNILVHTYESVFNINTRCMFDLQTFDYIVDTLGDIPGKLYLIETARAEKKPVLSCMGVHGRADPHKIEIRDISKTRVCPVCGAIRKELQKKGIRDVKVLFSREHPRYRMYPSGSGGETTEETDGTLSYMSGIAGMLIVHEILKDLLEDEDSHAKKRPRESFGLAFHKNRLYNTKLSQEKKEKGSV